MNMPGSGKEFGDGKTRTSAPLLSGPVGPVVSTPVPPPRLPSHGNAGATGEAWLFLGALTGLLLAGAGLLQTPAPERKSIPAEAVARVGDSWIWRKDYQKALQAVSEDNQLAELKTEQRQAILNRLLDEELLVQYGLELGLAARLPKLRAELSGAVLESLLAESAHTAPSEEELQHFYQDNRHRFAPPAQRFVEQIFFAQPGGEGRARKCLALLAKENSGSKACSSNVPFLALPRTPLGPGDIQALLGRTAARQIFLLEPGVWSAPVTTSLGVHLFRVLEASPGKAPPLEEIRELVLEHFSRAQQEAALAEWLETRREAVGVWLAEDVP